VSPISTERVSDGSVETWISRWIKNWPRETGEEVTSLFDSLSLNACVKKQFNHLLAV